MNCIVAFWLSVRHCLLVALVGVHFHYLIQHSFLVVVGAGHCWLLALEIHELLLLHAILFLGWSLDHVKRSDSPFRFILCFLPFFTFILTFATLFIALFWRTYVATTGLIQLILTILRQNLRYFVWIESKLLILVSKWDPVIVWCYWWLVLVVRGTHFVAILIFFLLKRSFTACISLFATSKISGIPFYLWLGSIDA